MRYTTRVTKFVVFGAFILLSGCGIQERIEANQQAHDDAVCKSYGLAWGSVDYANCRQNLENQRQAQALQAQQASAQFLLQQQAQQNEIFQQQMNAINASRPLTTNCTSFGNSTSCLTQ
jgi:hypothetical protein